MTKRKTTRSTCTPEMELGTHLFDINGYSTYKGMDISGYSTYKGIDINSYVTSGTFAVGGHHWAIRFYPGGYTPGPFISVYLVLMTKTKGAIVRASCDLSLVDHDTGLPSSVCSIEPRLFVHGDLAGAARFMDRRKLEPPASSPFLRDDRLTIQCDITVHGEPRVVSVTATEFRGRIEAPPLDAATNKLLGRLLDTGDLADVTFVVGGEAFPAHRMVLAMHSPVFRAELYGPMREAAAKHVAVQDMEPAVFRAMLHFVYTGCLPHTGDNIRCDDVDYDMIRHLLVAADRYALDRLKWACESMLCRSLTVRSAVATLAMAFQHDCARLKDVCQEFIVSSSATYRAVAATQEFRDLKESHSPIIADILEDTLERSSKIQRKQ